MEMNQLGLLEELLLAQSSSTGGGYPWTTFHGGLMPQNSNTFDDQDLNSNSSFLGLISSTTESSITFPSFCEPPFFNHVQNLAADPEMGSTTFMEEYVLPPFPIREEFEGMEEDVVQICPFVVNNDLGCKVEGEEQISESVVVVGEGGEKFNTSKMKKVGAQPSKNLMAERRRRKRLNDRLSMLRSIVPKISKMDRTAIVGDTIDYMKELLDKIQKLREEKDIITVNSSFDDSIMPVNHSLLRNNPKFEVERTKEDTRIELCCNAKPGMLLSTLGTLETLGLDVQQCVISCFNDFSLQASCSEVAEHRGIISPEDIKQALFRNAGYGGRCL